MTTPKLCPITDRPLPADLAGYQNIVFGPILKGDLLVSDDGWQWADSLIGWEIHPDSDTFRVYRKMAVPKPGDHDHDWKEFREQHCGDYPANNPAILAGSSKAQTRDDGKPPLALLPPEGIKQVALVQAYGAKKYALHDWRKGGLEATRITSCALRHVYAWLDGETLDKESGLNHLSHAACRLMFLLQNIADGTVVDDRYVAPTPPHTSPSSPPAAPRTGPGPEVIENRL